MSEKVYHKCGMELYKSVRHDVHRFVTEFSIKSNSGTVNYCPRCGEYLSALSMGIDIFTKEEWEYMKEFGGIRQSDLIKALRESTFQLIRVMDYDASIDDIVRRIELNKALIERAEGC